MSIPVARHSQLQSFIERLHALGAKPCHVERLLRLWLHGLALNTPGTRAHHLFPKTVLTALPSLQAELHGVLSIISEHPAKDGSKRLLLGLSDAQSIEAVLLPRHGLCVSSQVGCAVGCQFCMTGRSGLLRQLGTLDLLAQLALARRHQEVRKVVFMGMGEPAHNLDHVLEAIQVLGTLGGLGHKHIVFSTVGDPRVFERLALESVKPALAISLHTTKAALRETLLPRAPKIAPEALIVSAESYARSTGYPIQYQWTLMAGVNDGDDEVDALVNLLDGKYAVLNMIPFNHIDDSEFQRPSVERAERMASALNRRGVLCTLRQSAGQDVDAGCGQLRARSPMQARTQMQARTHTQARTITPPKSLRNQQSA